MSPEYREQPGGVDRVRVSDGTLRLALLALAATVIAYPYFRGTWTPPPGESAAAASQGESASTKQPATATDYVTQSFGYFKDQRYQEAIDAAREALKLDPHMAIAYSNIGAAYGAMQLWDEAIENTEHAVRLEPQMKDQLQGNLDQMIQAREQAVARLSASGATAAH